MFPPRWFLPYDAIFQLITALVALAVAAYALRGNQWLKERTLNALFMAFLLLAVGLLINGMTLSYTYLQGTSFARGAEPMAMADLGFWMYYVMSILAYSILVFAYAERLREISLAVFAVGMGERAGGSLIHAGPYMELILVILLVVIVTAQVAHLIVRRSWYPLMVTLGFICVLLSHILIMVSSIEDLTYVLGRVLELTGFLTLLGVLYGLRRSG